MIMSERKSANKNHPDFPEYIQKCRVLWAKYKSQFDVLEKKREELYPDWSGRDGPPEITAEERILQKKYNAELKELKKEYACLFTEEAPDYEF